MTEAAPAHAVPEDRSVLEALPGAVFVIDELGNVTVATEQAGALVELTGEQVVGTSVLDYVDPDATWAYAAAMDFAMSDLYRDTFSGPVRISVLTATRRTVPVDLWTANRLDDPELRGLVCLLAPPTAALGIAEAVAAAGAGAPLSEVAAAATGALAGYPVTADAAVVRVSDTAIAVIASHGVPGTLLDGTAGDEPWRTAATTGERITCIGPDGLPPALRDLATAAGYASVWAEPVRLDGGAADDLRDVVVVFRSVAADPTSNELSYLHQAAAILALAHLRPQVD